jgi:multicomponent K+:H+ antiporter subunit C
LGFAWLIFVISNRIETEQMILLLALTIGFLAAAGLYRLTGPGRLDPLIGLILLGQAANLVLFASGGLKHNAAPLLGSGVAEPTDPLPQALVLTAIVIGFGIIAFLLSLVIRKTPR